VHCENKTKCEKESLLVEQVSGILQNNIALKYKDPDCFTISYFIGKHKIEKTLLDFRASMNLVRYLVFLSLNLSELKPNFVTLLLSNISVKMLEEWLNMC
jgi:hypothetical protein